MSSSLKQGHKDPNATQGEISQTSLQGVLPSDIAQGVGESILIKRNNQLNPILDFGLNAPLDASGPPGMDRGALKS